MIAIVYKDGRVERYNAANGSYLGSLGSGKAKSVQVTSGQIIVTTQDGRSARYDAVTGSYKGSL